MASYRQNRAIVKIKSRRLILCEGITETNYFASLVSHPKYKRNLTAVSVLIYQPKDHSPKGLVEEAKLQIARAIKEKNPFDSVWLVFDRDGHKKIPETFHEANTFSTKINIAFTVTCFEYFILLHYIKTTKAFNKCDDVIKEIKTYLPNYEKSCNLFKELEEKIEIGIANSEWALSQNSNDIQRGRKPFDLSSYCDVHLLLRELIPSPSKANSK